MIASTIVAGVSRMASATVALFCEPNHESAQIVFCFRRSGKDRSSSYVLI